MSPRIDRSAPVLVCLDGSPDGDAAASFALGIARIEERPVVAAHVYDARIHESRFRQMEPGLPEKYQAEEGLKELRNSHGTLMSDGFQALSKGYLRSFERLAGQLDTPLETVVEEGRNYVGLLGIARRLRPSLISFGAAGLGSLEDGLMGSTAWRLMRLLDGDILVGRASAPPAGPVLAGIDGSPDAIRSLHAASRLAADLGRALHLAAAYDPRLHQRVFKAMADTMSPEAQAAVGLEKQKELHESLIDDGLGTLYRTFLDQASRTVSTDGNRPKTHLVADKAYRGILETARKLDAGIICLGRFGHNREEPSDIGATAETVARLAPCHVLLTGPQQEDSKNPPGPDEALEWEPDALERLQKVPGFARKMAKRGIEALARQEGATRVCVEHFEKAARRFRKK